MKSQELIYCPYCGYEYVPAEIFIPNEVFGHPTFIRRTDKGHIETIAGKKMDLEETYKCDNCDTTFKVKMNINFTSQIDTVNDFKHNYTTKLKSNISLKES